MRVLVLNPGSATLKAAVLDLPARAPVFEATTDWDAEASDSERGATIGELLRRAADGGVEPDSLGVVGYRVVHGGSRFTAPVLVDDTVVEEVEALVDLAPLHNPPAVAMLRAGRRALPDVPHVAAFDTAFHATLPEAAVRYPVPERWGREWGIRRYGFHGLSVEWSVRRAGELLGRGAVTLRLVVAHLGGGSSVTAVDRGRSVDTSMGMTPLEGLMMSTRSGSIDPGVLLRLLRAGVSVERIGDDLEHGSGLLGVSGRTADMRQLLAAEDDDPAAALAIEMFVRRAAAGIASAASSLPAFDAIVFTGGIGQNSAAIRRRVAERLGVLGVAAPSDGAGEGDAVLTTSGPAVLRVAAREDVVIAEAAAELAAGQSLP